MNRALKALYVAYAAIVFFICSCGVFLIRWYKNTLNITYAIFIYTIRSPLEGANTDIVSQALKAALPGFVIWIVLLVVFLILLKRSESRRIFKYICGGLAAAGTICVIIIILYVDRQLQISDYIKGVKDESGFVEEHYIQPDISSINCDKKRNLIYIYLESIETSFADEGSGGRQKEINYIPGLTELAAENICFSDNDKLGGFRNVNGTNWTAAATFASQTALPLLSPAGGSAIFSDFRTVVTIGDILKDKGYYQEYICGSKAEFGGRKQFFENHGGFDVLDHPEAINRGFIPPDYNVWWGYEDKVLYDIAKKELDRVSKSGQPFNITMLTVDTHFDDGYICELCENEYPQQMANVIKCADRQVVDFVDWCSKQDWYDDTVIVIQGDHPAMFNTLLEDIPVDDRTAYDCFINACGDKGNTKYKNRQFTAMDLMPTTLAAMGYTIPGDRIGLGTNLFSDKETLCEEYGFYELNKELYRHSSFYLDKLIGGEE